MEIYNFIFIHLIGLIETQANNGDIYWNIRPLSSLHVHWSNITNTWQSSIWFIYRLCDSRQTDCLRLMLSIPMDRRRWWWRWRWLCDRPFLYNLLKMFNFSFLFCHISFILLLNMHKWIFRSLCQIINQTVHHHFWPKLIWLKEIFISIISMTNRQQ